ncbi:MAG: sulfatase [Proteobacteria bacterium]|nr:MAG: sulfatase [Pseudomonadota bacterium]
MSLQTRVWCALLLAALGAARVACAAPHPHIVYITVDDLGWKDVGYHGSIVQTPIIDRLAAAGVRLEQFYVQPFSSQTRAAALTGRYPMRYGMQTMQVQWNSQFGLPADERLLPKTLKEAGYRTALLGKWQLGHARKEMRPVQRGFDVFYGHLTGEIDYFKKTNRGGEHDWWQNEKPLNEPGYVTTLLAQQAVKLIAHHDPKVPLFLWLAFAAPQAPLQAPSSFLDRYADVQDPHQRAYRAMISTVDAAVGDTLAALEARGMLADTLIVFHSTTGGAAPTKYPTGDGDTTSQTASNGPYRDSKGSLYEGALRAVAFAVWPEHISAGVVNELMHTVDLYPTILAAVGVPLKPLKPLDGIDQWQTISAGSPSPRKEVLLDIEDFRGALRVGNWKLVHIATLPSHSELYNLHADPSEEDNQVDREPERVAALLKRLTEYAWEMTPSRYLDDLMHPHRGDMPIYWGDNPVRP